MGWEDELLRALFEGGDGGDSIYGTGDTGDVFTPAPEQYGPGGTINQPLPEGQYGPAGTISVPGGGIPYDQVPNYGFYPGDTVPDDGSPMSGGGSGGVPGLRDLLNRLGGGTGGLSGGGGGGTSPIGIANLSSPGAASVPAPQTGSLMIPSQPGTPFSPIKMETPQGLDRLFRGREDR